MLEVRKSIEVDFNFLDRVQQLDAMAYSEKYQGEGKNILARYNANKDSFLLLFDGDQIVGYLCFFPISDELKDKIKTSEILCDDNISSKDVLPYSKENENNLYIISLCVSPQFRGGNAVKILMREFVTFVREKGSNGYEINEIYASATSSKGRSTLQKAGFSVFAERENFAVMKTETSLLSMAIKADMCFFTPCRGKYVGAREKDDEISPLEKVSRFEFNKELSDKIETSKIDTLCLEVLNDDNICIDKPIFATMYLTTFNELSVVMLMIKDYIGDPSDIVDMASNGFIVHDEGRKLEIGDEFKGSEEEIENSRYRAYLEKKGLYVIGAHRSCVTLQEQLSPQYMASLLSGEAYNSGYIHTEITSEEYLAKAQKNIAQYSFSKIYAGYKNVVNILPGDEDSFEKRFKVESLLVFILEMLCLQICSIETTNNEITRAINGENGKGKSVDEQIDKEGFAKTYTLWNLNYYKFTLSQNIHDAIADEFGIARMKETYQENNRRLQDIIVARENKREKKNARQISLLLLIFTLFSGLNTIEAVISKFISTSGIDPYLSLYLSLGLWGVAIVIFVFLQFKIGDKIRKAIAKRKK